MNYKVFFLLVVIFTVSCLVGCQTFQDISMGPQTHFDYPNSNIVPLGPVKAKTSGETQVLFFGDLFPKSENYDKVYNTALSKVNGANLITDYVLKRNYYNAVLVNWTEYEIEGTANKMVRGQQELK